MSEREGGTRPEELEHIFKDRPDILARLLVVQPHLIQMLSGEITADEVNKLLDAYVEKDPGYEELFNPNPALHNRNAIAALRRNITLGQLLIKPPEDTPREDAAKAA